MSKKTGIAALLLFFLCWIILPTLAGLDFVNYMTINYTMMFLVGVSAFLVAIAFKPSRSPV